MYNLSTNEKSGKGFNYVEVNSLQNGYFYEDAVGNRYLVMYDNAVGKYAICISSGQLNTGNVAYPGRFYDKYSKFTVRMVEPGTKFIFEQDTDIPF